MKKLNFKRVKGERFLCFGDEGIDIDLTSFGNIVLVMGTNFDDLHRITKEPGSNGTGKSTVQDLICWVLFGKPVKRKLTGKDVRHKGSTGTVSGEVYWEDYKVLRTAHKSTLQFWQSKDGIWDEHTEISKGSGMPATQKEIEKALGLNYRTFVNIVVFDDNNESSFLECDAEEKRTIVENLLSLDKYRDYSKNAKDYLKELDREIKSKIAVYERALSENDACTVRIAKIKDQDKRWKEDRAAELVALKKAIETVRASMSETEDGEAIAAYEQTQERLKIAYTELLDLEGKQKKLRDIIEDSRTKLNDEKESLGTLNAVISGMKIDIKRTLAEHDAIREDIDRMNNLELGTTCDVCFSTVDEKNFKKVIKRKTGILDKAQPKLEEDAAILDAKVEESKELSKRAEVLNQTVRAGEAKHLEIGAKVVSTRREIDRLAKVRPPEVGADARVLEEKIAELKKQAIAKHTEANGPSPFKVIMEAAVAEKEAKEVECRDKKSEIDEQEAMVPYYKYWVKAFGDDGIRKYVIDGIVPALNAQIAYWLELLIYGNISLSFDASFDETIQRVPHTGDPFVYYALSGGERRRVNLALLQAFAHVMMLNTGRSPSVVFLDEVAINIDKNGVEGVYNMIWELSQEKQVFVTTHDTNLLDLLQGTADKIELERRKGVTKLVATKPRKVAKPAP